MSTATMPRPKVSLYCTEGGSDKVYTMWVEPQGDGFVVQAQWGPRGGHVSSGLKTPLPVPLEKAAAVYDKVLKEKKAKGYHEGEDAPAFSQVAGATDSGLRPMLLTDLSDEGPERFVKDDAWGGQEKCNGKRIMVQVTGKVTGSNRRGLECPIPVEVAKALLKVGWGYVYDGEMIGDVYYAFDLLQNGVRGHEIDLRAHPTRARHIQLGQALLNADKEHVRVVALVCGEKEKRALVERLQKGRKEGVVFKDLGAPYEAGRVENAKKTKAVKCKFYAEGLFHVNKWNDKMSVEVSALDPFVGVGDAMWKTVGNVTVSAKYADQIKAGSLLRVRYLYATPNRILYQPNLDPTDDGLVTEDVPNVNCVHWMDLKLEGKGEEE